MDGGGICTRVRGRASTRSPVVHLNRTGHLSKRGGICLSEPEGSFNGDPRPSGCTLMKTGGG
jgi:hypothetical protein